MMITPFGSVPGLWIKFRGGFYRYINKKENSMIFPLTGKKKYGIFYPER